MSVAQITKFLRRIEDFFIPQLCIICDEPTNDAADSWFCEKCLNALVNNHNSRNACPRCSSARAAEKPCVCEYVWDYPFEKIIAAYGYDDVISAVAQHIKYKGKSQLAYHMGFISAPLLPVGFADIFIPVPLHKARLRKRGYNQAEYFARGIVKGYAEDHAKLRTDILLRVKNTETQTLLDKDERHKNLEGAFAVSTGAADVLKEKTVALVDDVFTTGATTEACAKVLLDNGCDKVWVVALGKR